MVQGARTWTLYAQQADYEVAANICAAKGQLLPSVHSAVDSLALGALAAKNQQWGAGLTSVNGVLWLGLKFNSDLGLYRWQNGSPVDWLPSGINQTQPPAGKECMAVMGDGTWAPVSCGRLPASLCAKPEVTHLKHVP